MLCFQCREVRRENLSVCPQCGGELKKANPHHLNEFLALVKEGVVERAISDWQLDHTIDGATAAKLRQRNDAAAKERERIKAERQERKEREKAEKEARKLAEREAEQARARERAEAARAAAAMAAAARVVEAPVIHADAPSEAGDALSIATVLDDGPPSELKAALYENIGWFIGALLVLAGSIYGVREAWIALDETGRFLTVGAAFFAYHAAFIGLGALLARKGPRAGQVLSAIGVLLLPVASVAFMRLLAENRVVGAGASAAFLFGTFLTTRVVARRFELVEGTRLAGATIAVLAAMLPLAIFESDASLRFVLPLGGLAALFAATKRALHEETHPLVVPFIIGYLAVALEILALTSVSADDTSFSITWRTGGATFSAWLGVYLTAFALTCASLSSDARMQQLLSNVTRVIVVIAVALSLTAMFGVMSSLLDTSDSPSKFALALGVGAGVLAIMTSAIGAKHHALAITVTLLQTALTAAVGARLVVDDAAIWAAAATLVVVLPVPFGVGQLPQWLHRTVRGEIIALAAIGFSLCVSYSPPADIMWVPCVLGAVLTALAVAGGEREHWSWHYVALLMIAVTLAATVVRAQDATIAMLVAAALFAPWPGTSRSASARHDVAFLLVLFTLVPIANGFTAQSLFPAPQVDPRFAAPPLSLPDPSSLLPWFAAAAVVLALLMSLRDRTPITTGTAWAFALVCAIAYAGPQSPAQTGLVFGGAAVAMAVLAAVTRRRKDTPEAAARKIFGGYVTLPFARAPALAVADSAAFSAVFAGAIAILCAVLWISNQQEPDRNYAILAGAGTIVTGLVAFLSRGFSAFHMRGAFATLVATGLSIAIVAVTNRTGRPLPPLVVARNLSIIAVLIWGTAVLAKRYHKQLGVWLENEEDAPRYHWALHGGVAALAALLVFDAFLVGAPTPLRALAVTPPLMLLGPALHSYLLSRSLQQRLIAYATIPCLIGGVALLGAQGHLLGLTLFPLDPPGGRWVLSEAQRDSWLDNFYYLPTGVTLRAFWGHAEIAVAALGAAFAGALVFFKNVKDAELSTWLTVGLASCAATLYLGDFNASWPIAAVIMLAASAAGAFSTRHLRVLVPLGVLGVIHAFAQSQSVLPGWAGPAQAAAGLGFVGAYAFFRKKVKPLGLEVVLTLTTVCALLYGLAALRETTSVLAAEGALVLDAASRMDQGRWTLSIAMAATAFLSAASAQWLARLLPHHRAEVWTFCSFLLLAVGVMAGSGVMATQSFPGGEQPWNLPSGANNYGWLFVFFGDGVLGVALALAGAHALAIADRGRASLSLGERGARVLLVSLIALQLLVLVPLATSAPAPQALLAQALGALAIVLVVFLHATFVEKNPFALYVVQTTLVGAYALVRATAARDVPPGADAIATLALGFALVGATVLARRAGVPELAKATRRFAAVLPFVLPFVLPDGTSVEGAIASAASAALYAVLGWVEESRFLGVLGAACANLALFLLALQSGETGADIYLAPLGLLILMSGHIYAKTLPHATRVMVRVIGSGFIYAPAAIRIVWQIDSGAHPMYAFAFAGACLLGIALGMALHIRAYLVLGLGFLVLDIVASVVRASQESQRVGFFVLSALGLLILGGMVLFTLNKATITAWASRARQAFRKWD